jgi:amino acid adenylation domain-containing protein
MFTLQNAGQGTLELPGLRLQPAPESSHVTAKFDLSMTVGDTGDDIAVALEYASALFDAATAQRYLGYWRRLLQGMVDDGQSALSRQPLMGEAERCQVLYDWNTIVEAPADDSCIHELFERQVQRAPQATAVVYEGEQLSYGELNARANRLARHLRTLGVGPDVLVAICAGRGIDMMVALLAVLKAGGAYVPLDPAYPEDRLAYILEDSCPAVLVSAALPQGGLLANLRQAAPHMALVDLGDGAASWHDLPADDLPRQATGVAAAHLAYLIYTSGSTGKPKGVMVEHRNVVRLFGATDAWFGFNEHDVWTLFHSYAFDFSVWEIWGALLYGGRLVVVPLEVARAPDLFYALLGREQVTVLNQTPSAFRQLTAAQAGSDGQHRLRLVIFGGEALEPALLVPWYARNGSATQLVNMYGITETTVHVTYRPLTPADTALRESPVGCRIPDLRIYILDRHGAPVPVGVAGELYVGGAGVTRGYLNREELTASRFVPDPYARQANARMYRTGDVGRWLADGSIVFVGRNDQQVKIRGFRIELGEIEARLMQHAALRDAVVLARNDAGGDPRLVAYCIPHPGAQPDPGMLSAHLAETLPEYMVPSAYVMLAAWPLTANGKLDRKALPAPDAGAYSVAEYEAPQGEVEQLLAAIWCELLQIERVGRHDNFFKLGGHSLLAVTVMERLRQQGVTLDVRAVFGSPSLAGLAAAGRPATALEVPPNLIPAAASRKTTMTI